MKTTKLIDFARTLGFSCIIAASLTATNGRSATLLVYNTNNAGAGSLRQAIQDNNALGGGNTIVFSNTVTGTITLTSGELTITTNVTILGPGPEALTVSGNNASRIFRMTNSVVSLSGLQIRNGLAVASEGGGIANWGALSLSNCVVANCVAGNGGGVFTWGTLAVVNSTIRNNSAAATSGGIASFGSLIVRGSSIISNAYTGAFINNAGGIFGGGPITNCTIVANSGGDAAVIGGAATIWSSTIVSNISPGVASGGATVGNSIIARNGSYDVFGTFTSAGYNLIGRTNNSAGWGAVGDQLGTAASPLNPGLLPLGL